MLILIAGVVVGLAAVIPIGPMSMTIIGVASQQGRLAGAYAAGGVIAGDLTTAGMAMTIALAGSQLPGSLFTGLQWLSVSVLVSIGVLLIVRTDRLSNFAGDLQRPGTKLFTFTVLSPATLGSWLAIMLASPFMANPAHLAMFVAGNVVASGLWHPTLAVGAAAVGGRLSPSVLTRLARLGGAFMLALAATMVLAA